jgi:hypothetical protein
MTVFLRDIKKSSKSFGMKIRKRNKGEDFTEKSLGISFDSE